VLGVIDSASFYDFLIVFWNCSDIERGGGGGFFFFFTFTDFANAVLLKMLKPYQKVLKIIQIEILEQKNHRYFGRKRGTTIT
jgi:hypothetical protein